MAARKYDYYVDVYPKKVTETKSSSFFRMRSKKKTTVSKEPELRIEAFDRADANKQKENIEKTGAKAKVEKILGPERTVTAVQRITGSLRAEKDINHDELRKNINNTLPSSAAIVPKVPTEEIFKESPPQVETTEEEDN